ncbi:ABC transporter permease subunit, partial [Mesorhizobium sp. M1D.F.Ca.ET.234.01.1.1]|uniref:ABC transporter permease n=1 Tax=Mesorhizobium sp. M1D.F.Ca.ET.234.01.1.1 TaxID=2563932 RepID=UPI0010925C99
AIRSILGLNGFLNKALVALGILDQPSTLFVFNMNAILLTLSLLLIPFAILPIFLSLERIPQTLLRASDDLGASSLQTFLRITLPLSRAGIIAGCMLVMIPAVGEFVIPEMLGRFRVARCDDRHAQGGPEG